MTSPIVGYSVPTVAALQHPRLARGLALISPIGILSALASMPVLITSVAPLNQQPSTICGALPSGSMLSDGSALNPQQFSNASIIVAVAQQMGAGTSGAIVAVTAAFTESRLTNIPMGDLDSLGLFQERPSQGWGTPQQILDPVYATTQFVSRLLALPGWQALSPAAAAQAVERSAFPDRYQRWVQPASQLVAGLSGSGPCTNGDNTSAAAAALPAGYTLAAGTPPPVITAIQYALAQLGKPYVWGGSGPGGFDCSGLTMQAYGAAGIALPRTTYTQVYAGQPIFAMSQLAPGDLLFTLGSDPGPGGAPGHVGMFIGANTVIDAPRTGATIQLTSLSGWVRQLVAIRRMVPI
jgi:cell wall-associated NlpC family hydrolase